MSEITRINLPVIQLQKLDFLLGEGQGVEAMYQPDGEVLHYKAFVSGSRESCDRYVRVDYFADIPTLGVDTFRLLITYDEDNGCFRSWAFSTRALDPFICSGTFVDGSLVMLSEPVRMGNGLQKMRQSFSPIASGGFFYHCERWELDGWKSYISVSFLPPS